jgi:hypothetical protein
MTGILMDMETGSTEAAVVVVRAVWSLELLSPDGEFCLAGDKKQL